MNIHFKQMEDKFFYLQKLPVPGMTLKDY